MTNQTRNKFTKNFIRLTGCACPIVAKVGGLQSQGVKGDAVVAYREFLTTKYLKSSGFPAG
jgi:hypothetical protein